MILPEALEQIARIGRVARSGGIGSVNRNAIQGNPRNF